MLLGNEGGSRAVRASLPMYDLPELRAATDAWWSSIAHAMRQHGFRDVPLTPERSRSLDDVWRDPSLLLSQCCGRDLVTHLHGVVMPVAIPSYSAPGCGPGTYRSWLVVRADDPRQDLPAFAGTVAAINDTGSHSGWVALGHTLAREGMPPRFFSYGLLTGSHRTSLEAVAAGTADLASVDCVTYALLRRVDPGLISRLRVLLGSEPAPALPYITAASRSAEERSRLFQALQAAAADPERAPAPAFLHIEDFLLPSPDSYARSLTMAEEALADFCAELRPA